MKYMFYPLVIVLFACSLKFGVNADVQPKQKDDKPVTHMQSGAAAIQGIKVGSNPEV